MSSSSPKYHFFLSQNSAGARTAAKDIKEMLDPRAGLVVVPHFKLPQYGERFDDTEGRFPMMAQLKTFFQDSDDTGSEYWFAHVLPEEGGDGKSLPEYLAIDCTGADLKLVRTMFNQSNRYIATMVL
jgi:hypothetical protein